MRTTDGVVWDRFYASAALSGVAGCGGGGAAPRHACCPGCRRRLLPRRATLHQRLPRRPASAPPLRHRRLCRRQPHARRLRDVPRECDLQHAHRRRVALPRACEKQRLGQPWSAATCRSGPTGASTKTQADYGTYWGIPINVVDGTAATTDWPVVSFDISVGREHERGYPDKSDCAVSEGNGGFGIARNCGAMPGQPAALSLPLRVQAAQRGRACATTPIAAATATCWWSKKAPAACGKATSRTTCRASGTP